jgi:hypothetical protein
MKLLQRYLLPQIVLIKYFPLAPSNYFGGKEKVTKNLGFTFTSKGPYNKNIFNRKNNWHKSLYFLQHKEGMMKTIIIS